MCIRDRFSSVAISNDKVGVKIGANKTEFVCFVGANLRIPKAVLQYNAKGKSYIELLEMI